MTDDEIREALRLDFEQTADWRRSKAAEYPEDSRNLEAAALLDKLAASVETVAPGLLDAYGSLRDDYMDSEQHSERQCQTNANQTAKCAKRIASGCQLAPLGQRGGAVLLEDVASAEVAIVVKVIVDRGVDGGEFLQGLDVPEFRHCLFPSSERLV